jgi:hypothetical protein
VRDFKVDFENRIYTMFLESSNASADTIEVKVIMYSTLYSIYKNKATNSWHNHISKFELGKGLLSAIGEKLDEFLS